MSDDKTRIESESTFTVAELIAALQRVSPEAKVTISVSMGEDTFFCEQAKPDVVIERDGSEEVVIGGIVRYE